MQADFWHNLWATKQTGWHLDDANPFLVQYFSRLNLPPKSRIFIPLCGKTVDIAWLLDQGYTVVGVELNENAINELFTSLKIQPQIKESLTHKHFSAPNIDIYVGNIFDLDLSQVGSVDAVYDRASLVALPDTMRKDYTSQIKSLSQCAPQLLITFEYDQSKSDGPPFSISASELEMHYAAAYEIALLKSFHLPQTAPQGVDRSENVWLLTKKDQ